MHADATPRKAAAGAARFLRDAGQVLVSPTLAFHRIAASGSWVAPVVVSALAALTNSRSAGPLSAVLSVVVGGGGWSVQEAGKLLALFILAYPANYAASAAALSGVGTLLAGRQAGLTWCEAFGRTWRVAGWVQLPMLLMVAGVAAYLGAFRPGLFRQAMAAVPPPAVPGFSYSPPFFLAIAAVAWLTAVLVIAVRQIFATTTGRAVGIIVVTALLSSLLVYTPVERWVTTGFSDTLHVLSPGPCAGEVNLLARYGVGVEPGWPGAGDLVAYEPTAGAAGQRGGFSLVINLWVGQARLGSVGTMYAGRVIGLSGQTVAVREGRVYVDGALLDEPYLSRLDPSLAYPPDLCLPETLVPEGSVFLLPDIRSWLVRTELVRPAELPPLPDDYILCVPLSQVRGGIYTLTCPGQ